MLAGIMIMTQPHNDHVQSTVQLLPLCLRLKAFTSPLKFTTCYTMLIIVMSYGGTYF